MKPNYIYNLDDHPPIRYALLYGFQWAIIMFPALIITASLSVGSFPAGALDKVYFLQMTLLTSGLFTWFQALWGHRTLPGADPGAPPSQEKELKPHGFSGTRSITVTSGGARNRMGGPHVPEPLLT